MGEIDAIPMREYLEWQEFYALEPFGLQVSDAMHAHQIAMLANVNRNAEKRPEPFEIQDFLLFPSEKPQEKQEEPTVDGLTADQWKLLISFQSLKRRLDHAKQMEQADKDSRCDRGGGADQPGDGTGRADPDENAH